MQPPRYSFKAKSSNHHYSIVRVCSQTNSQSIILEQVTAQHGIALDIAHTLQNTYEMGLAHGVGADHDEEASGIEG